MQITSVNSQAQMQELTRQSRQTHEISAKTKQWKSHKYRNVDGLKGL